MKTTKLREPQGNGQLRMTRYVHSSAPEGLGAAGHMGLGSGTPVLPIHFHCLRAASLWDVAQFRLLTALVG